jgi:hypothetical protein
MSFLSKRLLAPVAAAALFALASATQVQAVALPVGGTVVPDAGTIPSGILVQSISSNYTLTSALNTVVGTGTYNISLYAPDTSTGKVTLTFNFQVTSGLIEHISLIDFSGANNINVTSAGAGFNATAAKHPDASTVSFDFGVLTSLSGPSKTFIISTDAASYTAGSLSFIDGATTDVRSFSPTSAPTPAAAFGGLGLLGLVAVSRKRQQA